MKRPAFSVMMGTMAFAAPAFAQFDMNLASQQALQRQTMMPMDGLRMRSLSLGRQSGSGGSIAGVRGGRLLGSSAPSHAAVATTYRRDPQVSAKVKNDYVDFVRRTGGAGEAQLVEADFRKFDPVKVWTDINRENDLHPGDMADALAAYLALNWVMANGSDIGAPEGRALRAEIKQMLSRNPEVAGMTERQKQAFAESLMVNFIYQQASYMAARKRSDATLTAKLGEAAEARFRNEMGVSLRHIALTPAGIVRKG